MWATGEQAAWEHYRCRGYRLVARNWRCALGELDLVVRRGNVLVFCEVKARSSRGFGSGFEAVHPAKRRRLRGLAEAFLRASGLEEAAVRFDVASVEVGSRVGVEVFEDAF